jgi:hypothetical protein
MLAAIGKVAYVNDTVTGNALAALDNFMAAANSPPTANVTAANKKDA